MSYKLDILGKYIDVLSGFAFKTKDFTEVGIPIIKIKNVNPPIVTLEDLSYVSLEVAEKNRKFILEYDDVLIALTGSHVNQINSVVGRVARVKYHEKTLLNQRVGKIIVRNNVDCDLDYVYYFLSQLDVKVKLASKAGGAANQANISPSDVKNLLFPCPELRTQKKIAKVLRAYDDLIENNQKQIKLLEEAAQRLYKEWFVDLRFPGYENVEIVDGVPEGWKRTVVGEIIGKMIRTTQIMTSDYHERGKYPIIDQSRHFIAGYTDDETSVVDIGKPIIVFGDHTRILKYIQFPFAKGADGTQLIVSTEIRMPQSLLYCGLIDIDLSNYHYARHFKYLKEQKILIPDYITARHFDEIASVIFQKIQILRYSAEKAAEARDRLLPKLLSGEIEL